MEEKKIAILALIVAFIAVGISIYGSFIFNPYQLQCNTAWQTYGSLKEDINLQYEKGCVEYINDSISSENNQNLDNAFISLSRGACAEALFYLYKIDGSKFCSYDELYVVDYFQFILIPIVILIIIILITVLKYQPIKNDH